MNRAASAEGRFGGPLRGGPLRGGPLRGGRLRRRPLRGGLLASAGDGAWSFATIRPGSCPGSRVPGHIHFEVAARGFTSRVFEIVFEGDPFVTDALRRNPAFSVRPIKSGRVTDRIVLR